MFNRSYGGSVALSYGGSNGSSIEETSTQEGCEEGRTEEAETRQAGEVISTTQNSGPLVGSENEN